jgi:hypothetical protein
MPSRSKTQSLSMVPPAPADYDEVGQARDDAYMEAKTERKAAREEQIDAEEVVEDAAGSKEYVKLDKSKKGRSWGYASMYLWFIVLPLLIWVILFTCKPPFVTDNINGVVTINNQKLALWSLIFSIVGWIAVYAVYYCRY